MILLNILPRLVAPMLEGPDSAYVMLFAWDILATSSSILQLQSVRPWRKLVIFFHTLASAPVIGLVIRCLTAVLGVRLPFESALVLKRVAEFLKTPASLACSLQWVVLSYLASTAASAFGTATEASLACGFPKPAIVSVHSFVRYPHAPWDACIQVRARHMTWKEGSFLFRDVFASYGCQVDTAAFWTLLLDISWWIRHSDCNDE